MTQTLTNFLYSHTYFAVFLLSFISSMGIPAGLRTRHHRRRRTGQW